MSEPVARTLQHGVETHVAAWVAENTRGMSSVLDLGAGRFNYIKAVEADVRAGIELFKPYVDEAKLDPDLRRVRVIQGDMRDFPDPRWWPHECVMLIDSLEHLPRLDAIELLGRVMAHSKRVLVFCPLGESPQEPCDGNDAQRHLSTWTAADFIALGFRVTVDEHFHGPNQGAIFARWDEL